MRKRTRWILALGAAGLAMFALVLLLLRPASAPASKAVAWRLQPDQFPLGTALQGSRVEMSLGVFSGLRPSPMPSFIAKLPSPIQKPCEWGVETFRSWRAKSQWRLKVTAPDFLKVEEAQIQFHSSEGPFAFVSLTLRTDRPGRFNGNLVVRLNPAGYAPTNIVVPISATVEATQAVRPRRLLITATPYECYATGHGGDFEPLARLTSRLAAKGIAVDYRQVLPSTLSSYSTILLAAEALAGLSPARISTLRKFVSGGGRLVVAADAFFVSTTPRANELLGAYGLEIINRDAAKGVTNSTVIADRLTAGVNRLDFWRPAPIKVTNPTLGRLLVVNEDGPGGFVAVSRSAERGEVIVLTQSLWWNWIRSDPMKVDNGLLLENLLSN